MGENQGHSALASGLCVATCIAAPTGIRLPHWGGFGDHSNLRLYRGTGKTRDQREQQPAYVEKDWVMNNPAAVGAWRGTRREAFYAIRIFIPLGYARAD